MKREIKAEKSQEEQAIDLLHEANQQESLTFLKSKLEQIDPGQNKINQSLILRASADLFLASEKRFEIPHLGSSEWWDLVIKHVKAKLSALIYCRLERKTWTGSKTPIEINPGRIPPNYQQTWIIQTKNINAFKLIFDTLNLDWGGGDKVYIFNAELKPNKVWKFTSQKDIDQQNVPCQLTLEDPSPYCQFYLILQTGPNVIERRFRLWGLEVINPVNRDYEALLIDDDLNYKDKNKPWIKAYTTNGQFVALDKPWDKASTQLVAGPLPELIPEEGWYLLGKNINANPEEMTYQKFYSFVFYNERSGRLRAYLFNHDFDDTDITGYTVTLSIWSEGGQQPLEGAFFPVDPRPDQWGSVTLPIWHAWRKGSWAFVETPILYPMVKNLPGKINGPPGSEPNSILAVAPFLQKAQNEIYDSVYEDTTESGSQNLKLRLTVQPFQKGTVDLEVFGKAVGTATQGGGSSTNLLTLLKKGKGAIDYFKTGQKTYKSVKDGLGAAASTGMIAPLMALGSAGWGAAFAAVGLIASFLSSDKPMQLSVELALRAQAQGQVVTLGTAYEHSYYFPGKFNLQSAHANGLQKNSIPDTMARYDRPLGHFGMRYNPALLTLPMGLHGYDWGGVYTTFPAKKILKDKHDAVIGENKIPYWLPIIINPFADIGMIKPIILDGDSNLNQAINNYHPKQYDHQPWFHFIQDLSPKSFITPEPGDTGFPKGTIKGQGTRLTVHVIGQPERDTFALEEVIWMPQAVNPHITNILGTTAWVKTPYDPPDERDNSEGIWLEVTPVKFSKNLSTMTVKQKPICPSTYSAYDQIKEVRTHTYWQPIYYIYVKDYYNLDGELASKWFPGKYDPSSLPMTAFFCHEQPYYYYGRTRNEKEKVILEKHTTPITAQITLAPIDWLWTTITASGGGGFGSP